MNILNKKPKAVTEEDKRLAIFLLNTFKEYGVGLGGENLQNMTIEEKKDSSNQT